MRDLFSSWNSLSKETIINCFKKAGISESSKQLAVTDADEYFKALTEDLSNLQEIDQNEVQEELNNYATTVPISSDEDILAEILDPEKDNEIVEDIDDVDVHVEGPN